MNEHFETLGIQPSATQEEIQAAYERLKQELDPQKHGEQEFFVEEFAKVQEAYEVLYNSSILSEQSQSIPKSTQQNNVENNTQQADKTRSTTRKFLKSLYAYVYGLFLILVPVLLSIYWHSLNRTENVSGKSKGSNGRVYYSDTAKIINQNKIDFAETLIYIFVVFLLVFLMLCVLKPHKKAK